MKKSHTSHVAAKRQKMRDDIFQVARHILLRSGPEKFSLSDVAQHLGITKPNLYYYVGSKDELIFTVWLEEWMQMAARVADVVSRCKSGADALDSMMRFIYQTYRQKPGLFRLMYLTVATSGVSEHAGSAQLDKIRPSNELLYEGVASQLATEQNLGLVPEALDTRRLVFTAHTAVIGLLTMQNLTESASDPLVYDDTSLIDELCATFQARCRA